MKNFPAPLSPLPHPLSSQQIKLGFFTHRLEWLRCTCLGCSGPETEWSSEHWTPLLAPIQKGRRWGAVASLWAWASSKENSLLKNQMQLLQSMNRKDIVLSHMSSWPHMIPYIQGFNLDWHFSYRSTLWAQNVSKQQRPPLGRDVEVDIICGNYWGAAPGVTLTLDRDTRGGAGTLGLCDRRRRRKRWLCFDGEGEQEPQSDVPPSTQHSAQRKHVNNTFIKTGTWCSGD